jgi:hypothetical protein
MMMLGMPSMTHLISNSFKKIDKKKFNNHLKQCCWSQSFSLHTCLNLFQGSCKYVFVYLYMGLTIW